MRAMREWLDEHAALLYLALALIAFLVGMFLLLQYAPVPSDEDTAKRRECVEHGGDIEIVVDARNEGWNDPWVCVHR